MTIRAIIRTCLLTGSVFLSSCAYMQTHKNIVEYFSQHTGYRLSPDFQLFKSENRYYLSADRVSLEKRYPVVHDSIFLSYNNEPILEPADSTTTRVYKEISAGTATVLQETDGYAELSVLRDELNSNDSPWEESIPADSAACKIKAEITGKPVTWIDEQIQTQVNPVVRLISSAEQVVIDWPGTVLYNVAIPVMAPFVFFYEFLTEE